MAKETKHERFRRIAQERKGHVLECLQALGNCSDPASYSYDVKELSPIFQDIVEKLAEVRHRLMRHSPYPFIPFQLGPKAELEVDGRRCCWAKMVPMKEVLVLLRENGTSFTALKPIRDQYAEQFGNELCWNYPLCFGDHLGCVILAVREGILCLPYDSVDVETYEQFCLESIQLLTAEKARELMDTLLAYTSEFYDVLSDICPALPTAGQAPDSTDKEEVH